MPGQNDGEVRVKLTLDAGDLRNQLKDAQTDIGKGPGIKVPLTFKLAATELDTLSQDLERRLGFKNRRIPVQFKLDSSNRSDLLRQVKRQIKPTAMVNLELNPSVTALNAQVKEMAERLAPVKVKVEFVPSNRTRAQRNAVTAVFGTPKVIETSKKGADDAGRALADQPKRATGGPVQQGRPYTVGEQGRETFVPSAPGRIVSNHGLRGYADGGFRRVSGAKASLSESITRYAPPRQLDPDAPKTVSEDPRFRVTAKGEQIIHRAPPPDEEAPLDLTPATKPQRFFWKPRRRRRVRRFAGPTGTRPSKSIPQVSESGREELFPSPFNRYVAPRTSLLGSRSDPADIDEEMRLLKGPFGPGDFGPASGDAFRALSEPIPGRERPSRRRVLRRGLLAEQLSKAQQLRYGNSRIGKLLRQELALPSLREPGVGASSATRIPLDTLDAFNPSLRDTGGDVQAKLVDDFALSDSARLDEELAGKYRDDKTAERIAARVQSNVEHGQYLESIFVNEEVAAGKKRAEALGKSPIRKAHQDWVTEYYEPWRQAQLTEKSNENPLLVFLHGMTPVPTVRDPWRQANLIPELRKSEIPKLLKQMHAALDTNQEDPKYVDKLAVLGEISRRAVFSDTKPGIDPETGVTTGTGMINKGAEAETKADKAWRILTPEEKRDHTQRQAREYDVLVDKLESAREELAALTVGTREDPDDPSTGLSLKQQRTGVHGRAGKFLKGARKEVTELDKALRKLSRRAAPIPEAQKAFIRATRNKRDLTMQRVDLDSGELMWDEDGLPVMDEQGYTEGLTIQAAGAARSFATTRFTEIRLAHLDFLQAEREGDARTEAANLNPDATASELEKMVRKDPKVIEFKEERALLKRRSQKPAGRFVGGFVAAASMVGRGLGVLGAGARGIGRGLGRAAAVDAARIGFLSGGIDEEYGFAAERGLDDSVPGYSPGGLFSARQLAPRHAAGKLGSLARYPGAVVVGEHGPEVAIPTQDLMIAPNHFSGDMRSIPGMGGAETGEGTIGERIGLFKPMRRHQGGMISVPQTGGGTANVDVPGNVPHAHGDNYRLYGTYDSRNQWHWRDLTDPRRPFASGRGRGLGLLHGGGAPYGTPSPPGARGGPPPPTPAVGPPRPFGPFPNPHAPPVPTPIGPPRPIGPLLNPHIPPTPTPTPPPPSPGGLGIPVLGGSPSAARGAPAAAPRLKQAAFLDAQNELRTLTQRIEQVRIQSSDALQLTPVRALSVSLGQQFQERFGGRQQIRGRESVARQQANEASRVTTRLASQLARSQEQEQQARELGQINAEKIRLGGTLTDDDRARHSAAVLSSRQARRGADILRPEAEILAVRSEILERGEKSLIRELNARQQETGRTEQVFSGRQEYTDASGRRRERDLFTPRATVIRQQSQFLRSPEGGRRDTEGILQRGNVLRAQGMGLVGIIGGTMLFTRAIAATGALFETLGQGIDPMIDAVTNFTTTTNEVTDQLTKAVQAGGAGGQAAVAGQFAGIGLNIDAPALTRRATMMAGAENFAETQRILRAEANAGSPERRFQGITQGFNNGPLSDVPLIGNALGFIGQTQGIAERITGLAGYTPGTLVPQVRGQANVEIGRSGFGIPGEWIASMESLMDKRPFSGTNEVGEVESDKLSEIMHDIFGPEGEMDIFGFKIPVGRLGHQQAQSYAQDNPNYAYDPKTSFVNEITQPDVDEWFKNTGNLLEEMLGDSNDALARTGKPLGRFVMNLDEAAGSLDGVSDRVESTALALEEMPGGDKLAELYRTFGISLVDESGKALGGITTAFGETIATEVGDALAGVLEGKAQKSPQQLLGEMGPQIRAQTRGAERAAAFQRDTVFPAQFARQSLNSPLPSSLMQGILPTDGGLGLFDSSVPSGLAEWADAIRPVRQEAQAFIDTGIDEMLSTLDVHPKAIADVKVIGEEIRDLNELQQNLQLGVEQERYNEQLRISRRSIGDIVGLVGRQSSSYQKLVDVQKDGTKVFSAQTIEATKMGVLQRAQIDDQRQLSRIGLARNQRELNLQIALSRLQSPGETPAERATRRREAEMIAAERQKELDINKRTTQRGFQIQDLGFGRQLEDALRALGLTESERQISLEIRGIAGLRRANELLLQTRGVVIDTSIGLSVAQEKFANQTQISIEARSNTFLGIFSDEVRAVFKVIRKEAREALALETLLPTSVVENTTRIPGTKKKDHNEEVRAASGGIFDLSNPTRFTAGEAGGEQVVVLRNPRTSMSAGSGGGGGTKTINVVINNPQVRKDSDIEDLADAVIKRLHREAELVGA